MSAKQQEREQSRQYLMDCSSDEILLERLRELDEIIDREGLEGINGLIIKKMFFAALEDWNNRTTYKNVSGC